MAAAGREQAMGQTTGAMQLRELWSEHWHFCWHFFCCCCCRQYMLLLLSIALVCVCVCVDSHSHSHTHNSPECTVHRIAGNGDDSAAAAAASGFSSTNSSGVQNTLTTLLTRSFGDYGAIVMVTQCRGTGKGNADGQNLERNGW